MSTPGSGSGAGPEPDPDLGPDPMRVTQQASLTRSTGRIWLIVGGLFTLVALGVLVPEAVLDLPPRGIPLAASIVVAALYLAMIAIRVLVTPQRRRLRMLAIGMLAIAFVALVAVIVVATASWSATMA